MAPKEIFGELKRDIDAVASRRAPIASSFQNTTREENEQEQQFKAFFSGSERSSIKHKTFLSLIIHHIRIQK
jgi:hypothetical protein